MGKHRKYHAFSDDESSSGVNKAHPALVAVAQRGPPPPRGPSPREDPPAAAGFHAPAGSHVGADLTPQQVHAAVTCKRARCIGSGGFGKVYAADIPSLGRVAIKVATAGGERALAAEAVHLRRCAHPAVVRAVGSCWAPGPPPALALEHLPGGSLHDRIRADEGAATGSSRARRAPLGWRDRLRVAHQLAAALAYLHGEAGVVHCDVKPGNVLMAADGSIRLIDFGLCCPIGAGDPQAAAAAASSARPAAAFARGKLPPAGGAAAHLAHLTAGVAKGGVAQVHGWAGTQDWIDPLYEQLGQLCPASDVFSLGVVMAQLLFDSYEPREARRMAMHQVKEGALHLPPALADWPRDSAKAFGALAVRCANAVDRDARPSARDAAMQLRSLLLAAGDPGMAALEAGAQLKLGVAPGGVARPAAAPAAVVHGASRPGTPPPAHAAALPVGVPRVVALDVKLQPDSTVAGTATLQQPQPAPCAAAVSPGPEAQTAALAGSWSASGALRLRLADAAARPARCPVEFVGSFAAGELKGRWATQQQGKAQEEMGYWLVSWRPAAAPQAVPEALTAVATACPLQAAAAAALAEGLPNVAANAPAPRRCSCDAVVRHSPGVLRAL